MRGSGRGQARRGRLEREQREAGRTLAGVDEVGRGSLAGPVVAGLAVLDYARVDRLRPAERRLLRDSKQLSGAQRARMVPLIKNVSRDWQVAWASVEEIETLGIVPATFLAMRRAIAASRARFDLLLVDGKLRLAGYEGDQLPVVRGDSLCFAIAAASILAKEARDAFMRAEARTYPVYGFEAHVGYGTRRHLDSIRAYGICRLHRRTFDPIRSLIAPPPAPAAPLSHGG